MTDLLSEKAVEFLDAMDSMIGDPKVYRERLDTLNAKIVELDQKIALYGDIKATAADRAAALDAKERAEKVEADAVRHRHEAKREQGEIIAQANQRANEIEAEARDELSARRDAVSDRETEINRRELMVSERESKVGERESLASSKERAIDRRAQAVSLSIEILEKAIGDTRGALE